jgi:hypothetical protein
MSNFKIIDNLPSLDLLNDLTNLINAGNLNWGHTDQICINTLPGYEHDFLAGSGSLVYDWANRKTVVENGIERIEVDRFEHPRQEQDFSAFCSVFSGTAFEEMYHCLTHQYSVGRIRLMKSKPRTCLSWHVDTTPRIHYPIKTQEGCFMVINDEVKHLSQDTWWWTNTVHPHTAFNSSKEERIHLVAVVLDVK